jgi:hypothetical protein
MAKGSANAITLPDLTGTANNFLTATNALPQYNTAAGAIPAMTNLAYGAVDNQYAPQAIAGAQQGSGYGSNAAAGAAGAGQDLTGYSQQLLPYATSLLNMGFDPQGDLYNRTLDQTTQEQRAGQSARGIAMTPYGAGLENDALKNFNIDWQNNQLNRASTAAGAAGGLLGAAGQGATTGFNLGSGASDLAASAGAQPYNAQNDIFNTGMGALDKLAQLGSSATNTGQTQISDLLAYLGLGPGYAQAQSESNYAKSPIPLIGTILGGLTGGGGGGKAG